jgi:hypothetical protein
MTCERMTTAGVVGVFAIAPSADRALSVRELPGNGSDAGADLLAAHWHGPPCEPHPPLQQHIPLPLQQVPGCAEVARVPPQQECRARAAQRGHFAAGMACVPAGFHAVDRGEGRMQLQAVKGRVSAGTSTAASHTRILAVMLLQNCMMSALYYTQRLPRIPSCRIDARQLDFTVLTR